MGVPGCQEDREKQEAEEMQRYKEGERGSGARSLKCSTVALKIHKKTPDVQAEGEPSYV